MRSYPSPTAEGFRALVRAPAAFGAELVWRWTFGVAAVVIALWSLNRFFHAIAVSASDEFSLASGIPSLIMTALGHILGQVPAVLFTLGAVLVPTMSLMWMFASASGRTVTTKRLLEFFEERYEIPANEAPVRLASVMMLHFLRVVIGMGAVAAYLGCLAIAGQFARAGETPSFGRFLIVFFPLEFLVMMIASWLNWLMSLAPVFVVRDQRDWLSAIGDGLHLSRARAKSFSSTATWFGILRFISASSFAFAALTMLGILQGLPGWAVILAMSVIYVAYALVSDALLTARLAAYVAIAQQEIAPERPARVAPRIEQPTPEWLRPLPPALPSGDAPA